LHVGRRAEPLPYFAPRSESTSKLVFDFRIMLHSGFQNPSVNPRLAVRSSIIQNVKERLVAALLPELMSLPAERSRRCEASAKSLYFGPVSANWHGG
jgi:hypothetical protein